MTLLIHEIVMKLFPWVSITIYLIRCSFALKDLSNSFSKNNGFGSMFFTVWFVYVYVYGNVYTCVCMCVFYVFTQDGFSGSYAADVVLRPRLVSSDFIEDSFTNLPVNAQLSWLFAVGLLLASKDL